MTQFFTLLISSIAVFTWAFFFQEVGAYGDAPQLNANVGLIPCIACAIYVLRAKDIKFVLFFLVMFQTWNMFLAPYLNADKLNTFYRVINESYLPTASLYVMLSIWAMYIGFFLFIKRSKKVKPFFQENKFGVNRLSKICFSLIIVGYVLSIVEFILDLIGIQISFLDQIDIMIPATVVAVTMLYYMRGGRNWLLIVLVAVYTIYNFIYYVGGTLFIYSIILFSAPVIMYIVEKKKIPYLAMVIFVIVLSPIYLSRHEYRKEGLYSSGSLRMAIGMKILENEYVNFDQDKFENNLYGDEDDPYADNRFEGVSYLSTVVHCVEDLNYPYQYGKTFAWLPTMFIPRFMIPFRPGQNMGGEWAEYYHLKEKDWQASINFPMLVEFYANFGWVGMVVMSLINGFMIGYVMKKFNNGIGDVNLILLIFIAPKIIIVEANITLTYGIIMQVMFLCWLYKKYKGENRQLNATVA